MIKIVLDDQLDQLIILLMVGIVVDFSPVLTFQGYKAVKLVSFKLKLSTSFTNTETFLIGL